MKITKTTLMKELYEFEPLKPAAKYLVGCSDRTFYKMIAGDSFAKMHENVPAWGLHDMIYGMQHLVDLAEAGVPYLHAVYTDAEVLAEPQKEDVKLFYFPANADRKITDKYVLLCSGGAYRNVCNPQEAFPVASRLNELGITAFALNYRTWAPELREDGVIPRVLEDVAAALNYIDSHSTQFGIQAGKYAMGGFSAGGHLTALWGTSKMGYAVYGCKKPELLLLDYAFLGCAPSEKLPKQMEENYKIFIGEGLPQEKIEAVSVISQVDSSYPAVIMAQCEDDDLVSFSNWEKMKKILEDNQVPVLARSAATGGHGYGLGTGMALEGWIDEAVKLWMEEIDRRL